MTDGPWIPKSDMRARAIYRVDARNFGIGVWDGERFIGVRYKFRDARLSSEDHWDDGPPHGSCRPLEVLADLPADIPVTDGGQALLQHLERMRRLPGSSA